VVVLQSFMAAVWILIAQSIVIEEARLVSYGFAFVDLGSALGWFLLSPFWYIELRSTLRQAEAD
jgi:hypothetical protein